MFINKVQEQTISYMGLYLSNPVFTHSQLYITLLRVQSKDNVLVLVKDGQINENTYIKNIIYKEIFT